MIAMALPALWPAGQPRETTLLLRYDKPAGFSQGNGDVPTWIADGLDAVIHVYPFRSFRGDFVEEFQRTLFRDWISAAYREDRRLDQPSFKSLKVKGADEAVAASFKNFNGGAPREHLRVAVLATGRVALLDMSANSSSAFERNRPSFSKLLSSLQVGETEPSGMRFRPR